MNALLRRGLPALIVILLAVAGGAYLVRPHSAPLVDVKVYVPPVQKELDAKLKRAIEHEMALHGVGALSIALFEGIFTRTSAFGYLDAEKKVPARPDTVHRVGSISKLFTEIVIMQLVEEGKLSLDAPVSDILPDFKPENPYATQITLRHLLTHRSGLVREPPVGHYFDDSGPSLADTVASLNRTALVFEPGTALKYSNAGVAVLGATIEKVTGAPFEAAIRERILDPLGMKSSAFTLTDALRPRAAKGVMGSYDDPRTAAPVYNLGEAPAGNLYSTVVDLARFLKSLTKYTARRIASPELLEKMWTPQGKPGEARSFGLGFLLEEVSGVRTVGHSGAIYGFVADARVAPEEGVGVAIAANLDQFPVTKLSRYAMRLLLAAKKGETLPDYPLTTAPPPELIEQVAGVYRGGGKELVLREHNRHEPERRLFVEGARLVGELRRQGTEWVLEQGDAATPVTLANGRLVIGGQVYERVEPEKPAPPDAEFAGLIGEYGWPHDYIRVYQWNGRPHVRIEWRHHYEMTRVAKDVYAFPEEGLYPYEQLRFERDAQGRGVSVSLNGIVFPRRDFGAEFEAHLQAMLRPRDTLKAEALAAAPPVEEGDFLPTDLVDLTTIDPTIKPLMAYATGDNLFGFATYDEAKAVMQRAPAEALGRVSAALRPRGYGLAIHDAYRPWYVTKIFWDAMPEAGKDYVAKPWEGSRHNRGAAVDLTLYHLDTGEPVEMAAGLDEVSMRSHFAFIGGTDLQRWHRDLLYGVMIAEGFTVYPPEWWHYDFKDWRKYRIGNVRFEELD